MELLTGECKEQFEKWLYKQEWYLDLDFGSNNANMWIYSPFEMQYGVLEDFFDSENIGIGHLSKGIDIYFHTFRGNMKHCTNRNKSRIEAIKLGNDLYNQKNKT